MFRIIKHLKDAKWLVLLILGLLIVQAYCDLSLPTYMQDIVDVGLTRGGITEAAPKEMRPSTLASLSLFLSEDDAAAVRAAYAENDAGNLALITTDPETLDALGAVLMDPMLALNAMQMGGGDPEKIRQAVDSGMMTKEQLAAQMREGLAQFGGLSEANKKASAAQFIKAEYTAVGRDTGAVQTHYILIAGLKMLGFTLLSVLAAIIAGFFGARIAAGVGMKMRGQVFSRVVSFSSADIEKFSAASLITRSTNDIQQVQMSLVMILRLVLYAPVLAVGGILKVLATRTGMDWIIVVGVAVTLSIVAVLIAVTMPRFQKTQLLVDRINLVAREILTGLPVIRAFGRADHENKRFAEANTNLMQTQLFTNRVMTLMMPVIMMVMNIISLGIVWFGAHGVDMNTIEIGGMMAFMTYAIQIIMSFLMLSMIFAFLPRAIVAAKRVDEVIETKPSVNDKPETPADGRLDFSGRVTFEDVSFRYPDAEKDVLEHIQFTAEPGKTTAIIGSTGSGKSTLLNLIPRFYDVTGGSVKIDGVDIRDLSQQKLRSLLGYVPQRGVLFSGTIESNIKFGGDSIADADMENAARIAQAADFIGEKADKYQDAIAQGGTNVSGGQKQRLSIARAIAKKPKVLLFDDSFSALDYKTDVKLRRALSENVADATVVIVAQRISTVLHADQIIVLDEGRMAGVGTHRQLMDTCPVYQEIAKSQLSEAELKGGAGA